MNFNGSHTQTFKPYCHRRLQTTKSWVRLEENEIAQNRYSEHTLKSLNQMKLIKKIRREYCILYFKLEYPKIFVWLITICMHKVSISDNVHIVQFTMT